MPDAPARKPCAIPVPPGARSRCRRGAGAPRTRRPPRTRCGLGYSSSTALALEDDEDLLVGRVAVRRRPSGARVQVPQLRPAPFGAGLAGEQPPARPRGRRRRRRPRGRRTPDARRAPAPPARRPRPPAPRGARPSGFDPRPPSHDTPARGRWAASVIARSPYASTSRPSSPARRLCASRTRWTMQSPARTSNARPAGGRRPTRRGRRRSPPPRSDDGTASTTCPDRPGSGRRRPSASRLRPRDPSTARQDGRLRRGRSRPRPSARSLADYVPCGAVRRRSTTSSPLPLADRRRLGLLEQAAQLGRAARRAPRRSGRARRSCRAVRARVPRPWLRR